MKYTEKIKALVKQAQDTKHDFQAQAGKIRKEYDQERITGKVCAERLDELRQKASAADREAFEAIDSTRKAYAEAVKAANLVNGSMLDPDAELLKLPIDLTSDQFAALVDKHRSNPLMCELLRDYQSKRTGKYDFYLPTPEQKIKDFSKFCETANTVVRDPDSIQAAFFERGDYTPQAATEEI